MHLGSSPPTLPFTQRMQRSDLLDVGTAPSSTVGPHALNSPPYLDPQPATMDSCRQHQHMFSHIPSILMKRPTIAPPPSPHHHSTITPPPHHHPTPSHHHPSTTQPSPSLSSARLHARCPRSFAICSGYTHFLYTLQARLSPTPLLESPRSLLFPLPPPCITHPPSVGCGIMWMRGERCVRVIAETE